MTLSGAATCTRVDRLTAAGLLEGLDGAALARDGRCWAGPAIDGAATGAAVLCAPARCACGRIPFPWSCMMGVRGQEPARWPLAFLTCSILSLLTQQNNGGPQGATASVGVQPNPFTCHVLRVFFDSRLSCSLRDTKQTLAHATQPDRPYLRVNACRALYRGTLSARQPPPRLLRSAQLPQRRTQPHTSSLAAQPGSTGDSRSGLCPFTTPSSRQSAPQVPLSSPPRCRPVWQPA